MKLTSVQEILESRLIKHFHINKEKIYQNKGAISWDRKDWEGIGLEGRELAVSFITILLMKTILNSKSIKRSNLMFWPLFGAPVST